MVFAGLSSLSTLAIIGLIVIIIWEGVWKLMAMWKAAKKHSVLWFVVLAIFNTVGILPILYIYVFSEMKSKPSKKKKK